VTYWEPVGQPTVAALLVVGRPIESPFDRLTVPSNVEGFTALSLSRTSRPRGESRERPTLRIRGLFLS
jgi:hypothetical protein